MAEVDFIPWIPGHVSRVNIQAGQPVEREAIAAGGAVGQYADPRYSWTALAREGDEVFGCGGISKFWAGRGMCWALVGDNVPRSAWLAITRFVRETLDQAQAPGGYRRLEAQVQLEFDPGHRWMDLLGFEIEAVLEAWGPGGADFIQYKRIRK